MNTGRLATRVVEPEIMDDPALDGDRHRAALRSLARINGLAGSSRIVWEPIRRLAQRLGRRSLRVLDVATGAGDLPLDLCRRAKRAGLALDVLGVDFSDRAIAFAQQEATEVDIDAARFQLLDVRNDELPRGFDVATCSLFLHHLNEQEAEELLGKMSRCAEHLVVVSDLRRCRRGLGAAYAVSRLFSSSEVVHADACSSVRAAFSIEEVEAMARRAELPSATIHRRFPFRLVLLAGGRG